MSSNVATQWTRTHGKLLLAVSLEPKDIGRRIASARDAKRWTQVQFALEANVSPSSVARWEAGLLPPVRELIRIAGVLDVEPDWLVEPPEDQPVDADVKERLDRLQEEVALSRRLLLLVAAAVGVEDPTV